MYIRFLNKRGIFKCDRHSMGAAAERATQAFDLATIKNEGHDLCDAMRKAKCTPTMKH